MNKTALVTGGAGFIGTNLCSRLIDLEYSVTSIDNYSSGKKQNHIKGVTYIEDDCKNINQLSVKPNIVFHLGEYSKIAPSFKDTKQIIETNLYSTANVIEYCKDNNIKLVYAGSSTKYAKDGANTSPYAFSKAKNTELIKNYGKWFGLKYSICYFYNNYGPYQDTCDNGWETVISIFEKQKASNKKLTIVSPGTQRRNFTHVSDTVNGLIAASKQKDNDEYQLSSNESFNMFDLADMFKQPYVMIPARPGDRHISTVSNTSTYHKLNWKPQHKLSTWIKTRINTI